MLQSVNYFINIAVLPVINVFLDPLDIKVILLQGKES